MLAVAFVIGTLIVVLVSIGFVRATLELGASQDRVAELEKEIESWRLLVERTNEDFVSAAHLCQSLGGQRDRLQEQLTEAKQWLARR